MKFVGQDPLAYRLVKVQPQREFIDETPLGDIVVRVSHRLEPLGTGGLRITYAAEIEGPEEQAQEIGPMITADFPATMAALGSCSGAPPWHGYDGSARRSRRTG
jgi:hypothetical protein